MKVLTAALKTVLSARGLDLTTLADRSGVSSQALERALNGEDDLEDRQIESLAEELAVPIQAMFVHHPLPLFSPIDFRAATPRPSNLAKGTLQAIAFVERISSTFAALDLDVDLKKTVTEFKTATFSLTEATGLAEHWRKNWGIKDNDQLDWQDANKLYTSLRAFVESLGILVLHRQFKTDEVAGLYIHVDDGPHTIVINTTGSSKARKLFTLAHEFAHVLLRAEGASNPSVLRNRIERFCNRFAVSLLAPERIVRKALDRFRFTPQPDDDFIRLFARKLGISQEATYLRLVEMSLLENDDYGRWKAKFKNLNHVPTGDLSDGGGGGSSDPLRNKQTQYGATLLGLLASARRTGQLDEIDIYRLCGLKPTYQNQLFGAD